MANITVSSTSNFDSSANLGLGNGDNITINSDAVLTINSDVRWGQNAAVVGDISVTQGELKIDGSATWWAPFDGGTGTIPALGTVGTPDVTRSGSNVGEFLGIFTALGVAPSSGSMPSTGFLKLRTVSTTLADNDVLTLTGGATVTVNSSTGGQRGWIHFVGKEGTGSTTGRTVIPRLGKLTITGDWFELGTSNGTSGQTFQHYVADYVPAVQVETGSGTGVYEWWGNAISADFSATYVSTDDRGRFFTSSSAGVITFGGATYGKTPPNGARIRVPNVHVSTSNSSNWAANILPTTITNRYAFNSTGGSINAQYVCCIGSFASSNAPLYQVKYSCGADGCWSDNATIGSVVGASQIRFDTVASGRIAAVNYLHFGATYCSDIVLNDCWSFQSSGSSSNTGCFYFTNCTDVTFSSCGMFTNKSVVCWEASYCTNVTLSDCVVVSSTTTSAVMSYTGSTNIKITNIKFTSKLVDTQTASSYGIMFVNCVGAVVDGLSPFYGTTVPLFYMIDAGSQTSNIRIRNIGTRATPIALGSAGRYLVKLQNVSNAYISRCYSSGGSQANDCIAYCVTCDNVRISDCGDPTSYTTQSVWAGITKTTFFKRTASGGSKSYASSAANGVTATTETAFGTHFLEQEVSSTEVWLTILCGTEKSGSAFSTGAYTDDAGTILRDGSNGLLLRTLNDQVTWTWTYWIRGLTAFANTAPLLSGTNTGNFTLTYDLDKGTGFSGTFKTLSAANLSAETGISQTGVKLRVRAVCATANAGNVLKNITVVGTTSATDVTNYPYPYNEPAVTVTGGQSSTTAAVIRVSDGRVLDAATDGSLITLYPEWFSDASCVLRVRKPGWVPIDSTFTLTESGLSYPVTQEDSTIADTDPGALGITVTNHGASPVTWQSKSWSITVTVSDSSTAAQICQYLSWHTSGNSFPFSGGFYSLAWPRMVQATGSSYETVRGTLYGSAGATLKGVRIVDGSGNAISGFSRMQADDGTYYSPPMSASFILTGLKSGTEVRVYKTSDMSELAGSESVTTGAFQYDYVWASDIPITVAIVSLGYQNIMFESALTSAGTSIPISQQTDRQYNNP